MARHLLAVPDKTLVIKKGNTFMVLPFFICRSFLCLPYLRTYFILMFTVFSNRLKAQSVVYIALKKIKAIHDSGIVNLYFPQYETQITKTEFHARTLKIGFAL